MSPVSQETASRSDAPVHTPISDNEAFQGQPLEPSAVVTPHKVDDVPQQAATQPGSGSEVTTHEPRFKEKVIGYAKEIRGSMLGKSETKEQGQRIVHGEEEFEPKKVGPKAP